MIYLATPYSHPDSKVRQQRFELACKVAGDMMSAGKHVYSPIAHSHTISQICELPTDWDYWQHFDEMMIRNCSVVMVVMSDGWRKSKGVHAEIAIAEALDKPVEYLDIESLVT